MNTCIYLTRRDGDHKQTECGAPATHRAARAKQLFYCEPHAREVGRIVRVVPIADGYCAFEPAARHRR